MARRASRPKWRVPQGAEEADGVDGVTRVARNQIGARRGLDQALRRLPLGPERRDAAHLHAEEIARIVEVARSSGRPVVAHACTPEGMRRAILAGVETIEHGDEGTPEIWKLMVEKGVAYCPTLAAGDATAQYARLEEGRGPRAGARSRASARPSRRRWPPA